MTQSKLGSYELQEEIGRGGMGIVYSAIQPSLGRRVAIKVLLPHLSEDSEFVERFLREARAAASLEHPGIVTIHDVGEVDGTYFFSMRFLEGQDLEGVIRNSGDLPLETVGDLAMQLGAALGYAHQAGIVHRDVKPANVIVEEDGRAVLTDFGIAWASSETRLTRTGSSIGSPDYMSPEQITGRAVDQRSDLYSVGVVLYQMLTGQLPFSGSTPIALAYQHVNEPVPSVREIRPEVPEELDAIIGKLMAKEPDERYPSADEFLADLSAVFPNLRAARGHRSNHPSMAGAPLSDRDTSTLEGATFGDRKSIPMVGLALSILGLILLVGLFAYYRGQEDSIVGGGGGGDIPIAGRSETVDPPPAEQVGAESEADELAAGSNEVIEDAGVSPAGVGTNGDVEDEVATGEESPDSTATVRALQITSLPTGATVLLNGVVVEGVTPVEISIGDTDRQQVSLKLDGYERAGWAFTWEDLSEAQRENGVLHFPLTLSAPPGTLEIRSAYAATVRVGGKRHIVEPGTSGLSLPPGSHRVRIEAPEVFYVAEQTIDIISEGTYDLALPPVYSVRVFAVPGNCRLRVDGADVDDLPIEALRLVAGPHDFEFRWESLGETRVVTERVGPSTRQVSAAASR